jgi:hypothetical protein
VRFEVVVAADEKQQRRRLGSTAVLASVRQPSAIMSAGSNCGVRRPFVELSANGKTAISAE